MSEKQNQKFDLTPLLDALQKAKFVCDLSVGVEGTSYLEVYPYDDGSGTPFIVYDDKTIDFPNTIYGKNPEQWEILRIIDRHLNPKSKIGVWSPVEIINKADMHYGRRGLINKVNLIPDGSVTYEVNLLADEKHHESLRTFRRDEFEKLDIPLGESITRWRKE